MYFSGKNKNMLKCLLNFFTQHAKHLSFIIIPWTIIIVLLTDKQLAGKLEFR